MPIVYIGIILLCRIAQNLSNKKTSNEISDMPLFIYYSGFRQILSAILALLTILIGKNGFQCDLPTVLISGFSGAMLILNMMCNIFAMKSGTIALCSMFSTAGLIVPCIAGIFVFNIPIRPLQWFGVAIFLCSAYLLIGSSKKLYTNFSIKTLILLIGCLLSNGAVMFAQQIFAFWVPDGNVSMFSFLSFGMLGAVMMLITPIMYKAKAQHMERLSKKLVLYGVVLSVCVFIINQLTTTLAAAVPPVVLFTIINGGGTIIAAVVAAVCFREKLTLRSGTGIILGILALVIIKAFG